MGGGFTTRSTVLYIETFALSRLLLIEELEACVTFYHSTSRVRPFSVPDNICRYVSREWKEKYLALIFNQALGKDLHHADLKKQYSVLNMSEPKYFRLQFWPQRHPFFDLHPVVVLRRVPAMKGGKYRLHIRTKSMRVRVGALGSKSHTCCASSYPFCSWRYWWTWFFSPWITAWKQHFHPIILTVAVRHL